MEKLDDEKLVDMVREGSVAAQTALMSRYKPVVKNRAASYFIAGGDREDLIQEGMIGVFKAINDYDETKGASFRTFAELCIQRQIITAVKGASRMKHQPLNESLSLNRPVAENDENTATLEEIIPAGEKSDPEVQLLLQEDLTYITENIDEILTTLELQVWKMYIRGDSYKQIAEKLDKTNKAVDNAIRRAKKKLSEVLDS